MTKLVRSMAVLATIMLLAAAPLLAATAEGKFERSLKVSGAVDLDVQTGSGNITVRTGDVSTVRVFGFIRANDRSPETAQDKVRRLEANPPIEQTGNVIRIGRIAETDLKRNVSISYELTVPAGTKLGAHTGSGDQSITGVTGGLKADTGSGNINIFNVAGDTVAETGSGDVELDAVKGNLRASTGSGNITASRISGSLRARTGSGDIKYDQTASGDADVETGSGNIQLRNLAGAVRASTGSGDIEVDGTPRGEWNLGTGSGRVRLDIAGKTGFELDLNTSSGDIDVTQPVTVQGKITRHALRGRVGDGGPLVKVHTGSGDIEIR